MEGDEFIFVGGKLINSLTVKQIQNEIISRSTKHQSFFGIKKADLITKLIELIKQTPQLDHQPASFQYSQTLQTPPTTQHQQQPSVIQTPSNNNNNKRSLDKELEETPNKRISTNFNIENDKFVELEEKTINICSQMQRIEQSLQKLEKLVENKQQHQQIHKLTINNDNNYNSEYANHLYNKINNEFNFYRINLQVRPYDGGNKIEVFKIQEEFVKFIILKIMEDDTDINKTTKLIPSPIIYDYWETMVLNIEKYKEFLNFLGINILYKLQDKLDMGDHLKVDEIKLKYNQTIELYEKYFPGEINTKHNKTIWPTQQQQPTQSLITLPDILNHSFNENDEKIIIRLKCNSKPDIVFSIRSNSQMIKAMTAYCQKSDLNINNVKFVFNGKIIKGDDTISDLGIVNNDIIDAVLQ